MENLKMHEHDYPYIRVLQNVVSRANADTKSNGRIPTFYVIGRGFPRNVDLKALRCLLTILCQFLSPSWIRPLGSQIRLHTVFRWENNNKKIKSQFYFLAVDFSCDRRVSKTSIQITMALDENTLDKPLFCVYYHYFGLKEAIYCIKTSIFHQNLNPSGQFTEPPPPKLCRCVVKQHSFIHPSILSLVQRSWNRYAHKNTLADDQYCNIPTVHNYTQL